MPSGHGGGALGIQNGCGAGGGPRPSAPRLRPAISISLRRADPSMVDAALASSRAFTSGSAGGGGGPAPNQRANFW